MFSFCFSVLIFAQLFFLSSLINKVTSNIAESKSQITSIWFLVLKANEISKVLELEYDIFKFQQTKFIVPLVCAHPNGSSPLSTVILILFDIYFQLGNRSFIIFSEIINFHWIIYINK
jgi:hypothetical protein